MGGQISVDLQLASKCRPPAMFEQDLRKNLPLDASDITTVDQAIKEVSRLRRLGKWIHERRVRLDPPHVFYGFEMPDLSDPGYTSCMAEVFKGPNGQKIWDDLCEQVTSFGVTLDKCIRTGVENKGHPTIKTVGMSAGDEESYTVFADIFDPVIALRHGGYAKDAIHETDMNVDNILDIKIDDGFVISTRVRTGRNIRGLPFPPSCNYEERVKVERIATEAFAKLDGELKGDYYPLAGSTTYAPKPTGISHEEEEQLRNDHFLFQEPDSTLLLAGHMERDWPHGRGIFCNTEKSFLAWVNEEDSLRLISMEMGADIKNVFARFARATETVEKTFEAAGYGFCHSKHLGYILTCPSNLGTGIRASMMVKLPTVGSRKDFRKICDAYRLQARGASGVDSGFSGVFDMSNSERLGKSETNLVNIMLVGVQALIELEKKLVAGEDVSDDIPDHILSMDEILSLGKKFM
jgi:creatine kinase